MILQLKGEREKKQQKDHEITFSDPTIMPYL